MSASSSSQPPQQVSISMPVKLSGSYNYFLWKSFITPILKTHDILDLAEGRDLCPPRFLSSSLHYNKENKEAENPAYVHWIKKDQTVLAVINASLSHQLLLRHAVGCTSGRALWLIFEDLFAQTAETHVKQLKDRLENLNMEHADSSWTLEHADFSWMSLYISEVKCIVDGLHAAGLPVEDREVVYCVLKGLPLEYEELITSIKDRDGHEPVRREELYSLLLDHRFPETRRDKIMRRTCDAAVAAFILAIVGMIFIGVISFLVWIIRSHH